MKDWITGNLQQRSIYCQSIKAVLAFVRETDWSVRSFCHDGPLQLEFKGLKVTDEWQDNGTSALHQVAQHPIDQVY